MISIHKLEFEKKHMITDQSVVFENNGFLYFTTNKIDDIGQKVEFSEFFSQDAFIKKYNSEISNYIFENYNVSSKVDRTEVLDFNLISKDLISIFVLNLLSDVFNLSAIKSEKTDDGDLLKKLLELENTVSEILIKNNSLENSQSLILQKQQVRMIQAMQSDISEIQNRLKKLEG